MTAQTAQGRPIAAWMQVLDTMEEALARRLAEVAEPPAPFGDAGPSAKMTLQTVDERMQRIQTRLDQAERDAAEADEPLRIEAEAHRRWTARMTGARRRLADWAAAVR